MGSPGDPHRRARTAAGSSRPRGTLARASASAVTALSTPPLIATTTVLPAPSRGPILSVDENGPRRQRHPRRMVSVIGAGAAQDAVAAGSVIAVMEMSLRVGSALAPDDRWCRSGKRAVCHDRLYVRYTCPGESTMRASGTVHGRTIAGADEWYDRTYTTGGSHPRPSISAGRRRT